MEPRSSQYVLSKLTSLLSSNGEEKNLRQYWMPDDISVECYDCTSKFTSFRRRHHCRVCGQVFCSKCCSNYIPGKQIGYSGSLRVCTFCHGFFQNYVEQGGSVDNISVAYNPARRQSLEEASLLSHSPNFTSFGRKVSASAELYGSTGAELSSLQEIKEDERVTLKDPAALARLWERILDPDVGITLETHRYYFRTYQDTFQGCKLIDWFIYQDIHTSRAQAIAIGQALLTAGFMSAISGQPVFVDGTDLYQPCERHLSLREDTPDSQQDTNGADQDLQEPLWLQDLGDLPSFPEKRISAPGAMKDRHRSGGGNLGEGMAAIYKQQKSSNDIVRQNIQVDMSDLRENFLTADKTVAADRSALDDIYREHERGYLDSLIEGNQVSLEWRQILTDIGDEVVRTVIPDVKNLDEMDIRHYVKIKCVPGGNCRDSRIIPGEVFTLQLAHKGMSSQLLKPRIALVANSIVFQREESKLTNLDTLTMQEEEYIKNVTLKLLQSKPNLVLVEKTVSRLAQDIFLKEGVTLALNVKHRVLERLERFTGAKIISSIDSMLKAPTLGCCGSFYVERSGDGLHRKSLLVFDGCPKYLGGTIILQGEDRPVLARMKAILKRLLLLKYNWKFEKGFILNEYGWINRTKLGKIEESVERLSISPFIKTPVDDTNENNEVVEGSDAVRELEDQPYTSTPIRVRKTGANESAGDVLNNAANRSAVDVIQNSANKSAGVVIQNGVKKSAGQLPGFLVKNGKKVHPWTDKFVAEHMLGQAGDSDVQDALALFRSAGWRLNDVRTSTPRQPERKINVILPKDHCEVLPVLFSSYSAHSNVAPNFCVEPWVVNMGLYGNYDIALGGFLESFCFNSEYLCPNQQCNTPILNHTRRFCHSGGAVSVHMQKLEAPIMGEDSDTLMMWKYCTQCELITPIVPVSDETWCLSFAMFLHLLFHENKLTRRGSDRPDALCQHSVHQEHLTCFGKLDTVATFKYQKLDVLKLVPPCPKPKLPELGMSKNVMVERLKNLKSQGSSVYSSVLEKIHEMKGDNNGADSPMCKLLLQQESDFQEYRQRIEKLEEHVDTLLKPEIHMVQSLKLMTRDVLLAQQHWNKVLQNLSNPANSLRGYKKSTTASTSTEPDQANNQLTIKKQEPTDLNSTTGETVKKFISTILPGEREEMVPSPFPPTVHLITSISCIPQENISSTLVIETEPSTIIYFLLKSEAHAKFLTTSSYETAVTKPVAVGDKEGSGQHLELQFSSETAKFYCCSYFSREFASLRQDLFPDGQENFLSSISTCRRWEAQGGKSGLSFFITRDERFVFKQMSRFEFQSFTEFAPNYFKYLKQCLENESKTLLGKIVGVYKVGFKSEATKTGLKMDLLIIENLFYNKDIEKSYDLKGSVRNRLTCTEGKSPATQVLLDENLLRGSCESPLYINARDKDCLMEAVNRDTAFLSMQYMMDYSLLAGVSRDTGELVVGIIDYIRTFTWDKKLEMLVKSVRSNGVFGGPAKAPTVINPDLYRKRFVDAMTNYFLLVPD